MEQKELFQTCFCFFKMIEHTIIPTADTCDPRRKYQPRQSVRHTETPRSFSQEVNFANSALSWTIWSKSISLI